MSHQAHQPERNRRSANGSPAPGGARGLSPAETARLLATVLLPNLARGVVLRRPATTRLVTALGADRAAVATLRALRERHGEDPLPLRLAGRPMALVLSPEDVGRLLRQTPEPFSPGGGEKHGALSHFQPHGVLISDHRDRAARRAANEAALAPGRSPHPDGDVLAAHADEEARALALAVREHDGILDWPRFSASFHAMARRAVFGSFAAGDRGTSELLRRLRARANWAYAAPTDHATRREFLERVRASVERAEPGSLAARLTSGTPATRNSGGGEAPGARGPHPHPEDQVAHWLFAFDAAAIAAFRSLALLTSLSPGAYAAREEARERQGLDLPLLRATVRESVRLWPTTLVVIRESTRETTWREEVFEAGTAFLVVSSYFHRDSSRLPYADAFKPDLWLDGGGEDDPGLLPFSHGPAGCAGRDLVPLVVSLFLRSLVGGRHLERVDADGPLPASGLPASLNHFALRFSL